MLRPTWALHTNGGLKALGKREKGDNQADVDTEEEEVGEGLLHITTFVCSSKLIKKKKKSMRIWSL